MLDRPIEPRQAAGLFILFWCIAYLIFDPLALFTDWDGMLGLCSAAGIGFAVPRPWLPLALRVIAFYFAAMTIRWFPWHGFFNFKTVPIDIAFALAAVAMWLSATIASRRPPEPPVSDLFDDEPTDPSISTQSTG